jgi:hypothetical protein
VTVYLENGGRLEHAQQMAAHESPRTTKLYDRPPGATRVGAARSRCRTIYVGILSHKIPIKERSLKDGSVDYEEKAEMNLPQLTADASIYTIPTQ